MYVKHSKIELPDDVSKKIWRYISFAKFVHLIDSESLFFCRADKFTDKWEGVFPKKMIEIFDLGKKTLPSSDGKEYSICEWQKMKEGRSHLINCWHLSDHESDAMWQLYSGENQGIAIQSTLQRFIDSFKITQERVWIGLVKYEDFNNWRPDFSRHDPIFLKTFFLKRLGFEHEKEIRAIINKAYKEHKCEVGIPVEVDLSALIENIYISPILDDPFKELVENIIRKYNFNFNVKKSELGIKAYM